MPRFPEQFIQQVAQATDIVELVGQYVALKKKGREFVGLCPFHDDKRPSMYVSPAKQIFKCFACQAGGGVYQWLMLYEKMPFPEAVRTLAERANISLPADAAQARSEPSGYARGDLAKVARWAAQFYRNQLRSPSGTAALEYARQRGFTEESINRFGLGYSPDAWDGLIKAAGAQGISQRALLAAGLAAERDSGGCYDRFRNRLMFPIIDPQGRVIGFGGRALSPDERAKYLNSPESALFDKSSQLYALNWARESIVRSQRAVVVEGYLDALIPIQDGIKNVVATLGTSLTERHVRLLSRYAGEVVLVFDADVAGQAAAERALEIFLAQRLHVRVATIPAGKDPCDYCLAEGPEGLQQLIDAAPDALEYAWSQRQQAWREAGSNLAERSRLAEGFLRLVVSSASYGGIDELRRGQLAQHIAHLLGIPAADVQQQMRRLGRRISRSSGQKETQQREDRGESLAERHILEVLLNRPDLFDEVVERLDPEDFADPNNHQIARAVWNAGHEGRLNLDELLAAAESPRIASRMVQLSAEGERRQAYEQTLDGAVEQMLYRRHRRSLDALRSRPDDDSTLRELTQRLRDPDVRRRPRVD